MLNPNTKYEFLVWGGVDAKEIAGRIRADIYERATKRLNMPDIKKQVRIEVVAKGAASRAQAFFEGLGPQGDYVISGTASALSGLRADMMTAPFIEEASDVQSLDAMPRVLSALSRASHKIHGMSQTVDQKVAELLKEGPKSGLVYNDRGRLEINGSSLNALQNLAILYEAFQRISQAA
jgi:hypothetical protein